jgi:hypothetical protein
MTRARFRIAIHGRPKGVSAGSQTPLPVTFEEAQGALERLPRLFFEPDGSFGWFSAPGEPRWELGGMLYDRGDRVMYAEITGTCSAADFLRVLDALGQNREPLVVQLLEQALFLDAETFCQELR